MTNGVNFNVGNKTAQAAPRKDNEDTITRTVETGARRQPVSFRDMANSLTRPLSRTDSSESLNQAKKKFDELFESKKSGSRGIFAIENYDLIAVDGQEQGLGLSSIVFSMLLETPQGVACVYHTMIVEGSGVCGPYNTVLPTIQVDQGNRRFEVPQTPGELVNEYFTDRIAQIVKIFYGRDEIDLVPASTSVLPNESDLDNPSTVNALATCAVNAVATVASETFDLQVPFSLSAFSDAASVEVNVDTRGREVLSSSGSPIRSDIRVDVTGTMANDNGTTRTALTSLSSYLTLKFNPSEVRRNSRSRRGEEDRPYQAVLEVTAPDVTYNAITTELMLLSLASVNVLRVNDSWRQALLPNINYPERQIGALALSDPKDPVNLDLLAATVNEDDVYRLIDDFVRDDLAVVIQVPTCDEMSWLNGVLLASAAGDDGATAFLIKALDNLTEDNFSHEFDYDTPRDAGQNMFKLMESRIPLGYFIDRDKERRDLRTIDELYLLNLPGVSEDEAFELSLNWQDLVTQENIPVEQRSEEMLQIIEQCVGVNNVHLKGWANQVIVQPAFLDAIAAAFDATGVRLDRTSSDSTGARRRRGSDILNQYASDGAYASKMFRTGRGRDNRSTSRSRFVSSRRY